MRTDDVINEIEKVVRGKRSVITMVVATLLAGGHVLLEDIPGVGKTTLAVALSKALGLDFNRVQFTPDVVPGDLLGFTYYDQKTGQFIFREGSIYTNLFLADEINRTSPKTQSALLEVMEERHATVEGNTRELPVPFFVIATENPYGSSGTQKLPESQLDRFMTCMSMGYPDHGSEVEVLMNDSHSRLDDVQPIFTAGEIAEIQRSLENVFTDRSLYDYNTPQIRIVNNGTNLTAFALFPAKAAGGLGQERTSRIASLIGANGGYTKSDKSAHGIGGV
ncbi:MAG: AAA family ATPase, partial [Lachnospiraceae bacterium]|nr:AAA family ATPase [Lachnospiraceae bacterium]